MACHLRKLPYGTYGDYEATTGDSVTLFAEHYDKSPQGLPSDFWVNDSDYSFQFAAHPIKGGRLTCISAKYGDQVIIADENVTSEIHFTVQSGKERLRMVFVVGSTPYDSGQVVEDCGDGTTQTVGGMSAEYPVVTITIEGKP